MLNIDGFSSQQGSKVLALYSKYRSLNTDSLFSWTCTQLFFIQLCLCKVGQFRIHVEVAWFPLVFYPGVKAIIAV